MPTRQKRAREKKETKQRQPEKGGLKMLVAEKTHKRRLPRGKGEQKGEGKKPTTSVSSRKRKKKKKKRSFADGFSFADRSRFTVA